MRNSSEIFFMVHLALSPAQENPEGRQCQIVNMLTSYPCQHVLNFNISNRAILCVF